MESVNGFESYLPDADNSNSEELKTKLRAVFEDLQNDINQNDEIDRLRKALHAMRNPETFAIGDIVVWRSGMKNKTNPPYGKPVIVMNVYNPPILDNEADSDSAYFQEPLSVRLGMFGADGSFISYVYDGRRSERYKDTQQRIEDLLESSN